MTPRWLPASILVAALGLVTPAFGQTPTPPPPPPSTEPAATSTPTVFGDTGIWFVPTGDVLRSRKWSFSLGRTNTDDGQGFSDISTFPLTVGVGVSRRLEVFGSLTLLTRIDRDSRPLFFASSPATIASGSGGGILLGYPLERKTFMASGPGDAWVGAKVALTSQADGQPLAFAVRAMAKLPTGSTKDGASTGKTDFTIDAIASRNTRVLEVTGFAGIIVRGNPDGYQLTNGLRWGFGAAFPARLPLRITTELFGERYNDTTLTAPAGQIGADGSPVPTTTTVKSPATFDVGLTLQLPQGFFVAGAVSWNVHMNGRHDAACAAGLVCPLFTNTPKDLMGIQVRLGFDPGARGEASRGTSRGDAIRGAGVGAGGGGAAGAGGAGAGGAAGASGAGGARGGAGGGAAGAGGGAGGVGGGAAGRGAGAGGGAAGGAAGVGGGAAGAGGGAAGAGGGAAGAGGGAGGAGGGAAGAGGGAAGAGAGAAGAGGGAAGAGGGAAGAGGGAAGVGGGAAGAGGGAAGVGGGAAGAAGAAAGVGAGAAGAGGGAAGAGGARPNRPATVRAGCDPCSVEMGKSLTVAADAQDPDGDPLTYRWSAPTGTFGRPTDRQTNWTAPMQIGPVTLAVVVDDGRGATTRDTITVQVVAADTRALAFDDVHFDFDKSVLRPDALPILDIVVKAMKADPSIKLDIEGNTCNIGTAEYNLALGERRARAVRAYLIKNGISADRLTTVSYGEEHPKYDNSELDGRRRNRRATLVVRLR